MITSMVLDMPTAKEASKVILKKATEWTWKNPTLAACSIAAAGGAALIVAPGAFSTIILNAVGFTGAGVQSGSVAAAAQSSIGNVAAGSMFAALQSAGTGGAALGIMNGVIQGAGTAICGAAAYARYIVFNATATNKP